MATQVRNILPVVLAELARFELAIKKQVGAGAAFHLDASEATVASAAAADLATSLALVNDVARVFYGTAGLGLGLNPYPGHLNDDVAHKVKDVTNVRAATYPATSLATAQTLANEIKADYEAHRASATHHYTADAPTLSAAVATANASDLTTGQALGNALKAAYNIHIAAAAPVGHIAADATNAVTAANASDQGTLNTLLNEIKADFNAHTVLLASHGIAGALVATADASDLATSVALANALKVAYNAHVASVAQHPGTSNVISAPDATDQATLNTLLNELKADLNLHMASAPTTNASVMRLIDP